MSRVAEVRTYKTKPGKRAEFLNIFRAKSIPAHEQIGMAIVGPFLSIEDPDAFVWIRLFPDLASRDPMKSQFYDGELFTVELEPTLIPMLEKWESVLVDDSERRLG